MGVEFLSVSKSLTFKWQSKVKSNRGKDRGLTPIGIFIILNICEYQIRMVDVSSKYQEQLRVKTQIMLLSPRFRKNCVLVTKKLFCAESKFEKCSNIEESFTHVFPFCKYICQMHGRTELLSKQTALLKTAGWEITRNTRENLSYSLLPIILL